MSPSSPVHRFQHPAALFLLLMEICVIQTAGCSLPKWRQREEVVMEIGATKEEIVAHLNSNVSGSEGHPGLQSWRSGAVRLHVDGIPVSLPASIAVQAPRNFRLLVSNPLSGGQEVDIGSNQERFWIWSKESPQVMTASHEDVGLAIEELEMPVHIHPDWLMEVFGVVPLRGEEFELKRPKVENGYVELVATRQSPLGEDVERVIRVNVPRGRISEHVLRLPGGKVLARAKMDKYTRLESGQDMPLLISLEWPDAHMKMVMDIRNPECNCANLASNAALWKMPSHGQVVDIGEIARARREPQTVAIPGKSQSLDPIRAKLRLPDSGPPTVEAKAPSARPTVLPASISTPVAEPVAEPAAGSDIPEWAR